MAKRAKGKVKVSLPALKARIKWKLSKGWNVLKTTRGERWRNELGDYYIVDINRNFIVRKHVDPEELARELGVLTPEVEQPDLLAGVSAKGILGVDSGSDSPLEMPIRLFPPPVRRLPVVLFRLADQQLGAVGIKQLVRSRRRFSLYGRLVLFARLRGRDLQSISGARLFYDRHRS